MIGLQFGDKFPELASLYKDDGDSLYEASMNYGPSSSDVFDPALQNLNDYARSITPENRDAFKTYASQYLYALKNQNMLPPAHVPQTKRFYSEFTTPEAIDKYMGYNWGEGKGWTGAIKSQGLPGNVTSEGIDVYGPLMRDENSLIGKQTKFLSSMMRNTRVPTREQYKQGGKLKSEYESEFKDWLGDNEDYGDELRDFWAEQKDLGTILPKFKYHLEETPNLMNKFQKGGKTPDDNKSTSPNNNERTPLFDLPVMPLEIDGEVIDVYIAQDEGSRKNGLSNIDVIDEDEGMLFIFPSPKDHTMWMKDTKIPLDMIFMDQSGLIRNIVQGIPGSEELIGGGDDIKYVLELAAGVASKMDIQPGDQIDVDEQYQKAVDEGVVKPMKVLDEEGNVQMEIEGGERIFSRKSTKMIVDKIKSIQSMDQDSEEAMDALEDLGKYVAKEIVRQDEREPEYTEEEETVIYKKNGSTVQKEEN